jgi:hypothetical protein
VVEQRAAAPSARWSRIAWAKPSSADYAELGLLGLANMMAHALGYTRDYDWLKPQSQVSFAPDLAKQALMPVVSCFQKSLKLGSSHSGVLDLV